MATRMFIAVDLSSSVQARALDLIARFQEANAGIRWIDTEQMHITLKFLGDVEDTDIMPVCHGVREIAAALPPFSLRCGGAGAFPDAHRPRTLWLGLKEGVDELTRLHTALDQRMHDLGYPCEPRQYHPHLTLGRARRGAGNLSALTERILKYDQFDGGQAWIEDVVVYASYMERRGGRGPTYDAMSRCPLGG